MKHIQPCVVLTVALAGEAAANTATYRNQRTQSAGRVSALFDNIEWRVIMKEDKITSLEQIPLILDVKFFAKLMQVSIPTAYRLIEREKIPTLSNTTRILIKKKDLLEWLESRFGEMAC